MANRLTSVRTRLDDRLPVLARRMRMVGEMCRPSAADNISSAGTFHNNLIPKTAAFAEHEEVERIAQIVVVDDGILSGIFRFQGYLPSRLWREQFGHDGERLLALAWKFCARGRGKVAFRVPELDVRLAGQEV